MRREHSIPEELIVQVDAHRHSYFLSLERPGLFEIADEKAITTLATTVRAATPRHKRWLGSAFELRLISAARYGGDADSTAALDRSHWASAPKVGTPRSGISASAVKPRSRESSAMN